MTPDSALNLRHVRPWCRAHWDALCEAAEDSDLSHLILHGDRAERQLATEAAMGRAHDAEGFDPILRAWRLINLGAARRGCGLEQCPLCFYQAHYDWCEHVACIKRNAAGEIEACLSALRIYAADLGLLR